MKHFRTILNGTKNIQPINQNEVHQAFSCKTSVTVGWQPNEKRVQNER